MLMTEAVADCMVEDFEGLIDSVTLPDPDDRHVLAAAIRTRAQAIVTSNLKDFPASALAPHNMEAMHPDEFVLEIIDLAPELVAEAVAEQAAALKHPPRSVAELLQTLHQVGLVQSVAKLRAQFGLPAAGQRVP